MGLVLETDLLQRRKAKKDRNKKQKAGEHDPGRGDSLCRLQGGRSLAFGEGRQGDRRCESRGWVVGLLAGETQLYLR